MSTANTTWNVGRAAGRCAACNAELTANMTCWAALCDGIPLPIVPLTPAETKAKGKKEDATTAAAVLPFARVDFCETCWNKGTRPETLPPPAEAPNGKLTMFSFWKTSIPASEQKKKLLVDDSVLADVFARMEGKTEPQEVRFRFVLALILMRKRLLKYEGSEPLAGAEKVEGKIPEVWRMLPKATEGWSDAVHVINPHLTADQIAEVSQQLSAILAEEV